MPDSAGNWYKGDIVPVTGTLRKVSDNSLLDASSVVVDIAILGHGGVSMGNAATHVSTGVYSYNVATATPVTGEQQERWVVRFCAMDTSAGDATVEVQFTVKNTALL